MAPADDDDIPNKGDCSKRVAKEEGITSAKADGVAVVDSSTEIGFQKDSKLNATLYPREEDNDSETANVDVDIEQDAGSSSDADSTSKEQNNILRTTPGAFAINNPLSSSSSGNRPRLEQRPSLRNFTSSVSTANVEAINRSEDDIVLEYISNNFLEGSDPQQDLQDDLVDPETATASDVAAASATPCLKAIRVGSKFEVYEGEIVGDEIDEKVDTSPLKRRRKYCFLLLIGIGIGIAVVLGVVFGTQKERIDVTKQNSIGSAEHSETQATIDKTISEVIHSPSGAIISSNSDPQSEKLRDYLLSLLGPMSGPAGAQVFGQSGKDTSMDRVSALSWMVDDLAGVVVFDEGSSSPSVSIPEWKIFQRYVLALFYFATAGEGWDIHSNFLSKEHECSWSEATPVEWISKDPILESRNEVIGVSCNQSGRVQGLKFRWNDLSGTLPHELSYFKDTLEELDLGGGSISGTIPSSFTELTKLKTLGLNDNCLSGTIPEGLSKELNILERFNLINNGDLYGSLDHFCNKDKYANEGIFAIATECPLPSMVGDDDLEHLSDSYAGVECNCCVCCDRNNYDCYNQHTSQYWKSYNLNAKIMYVGTIKQFDRKKKCRTEANKEWIREKCPWYVNTVDKKYASDNSTGVAEIDSDKVDSFECAVDGSQEGSERAIGPFYWY